jgi:hypothetical protein
MRRLSEPRSPRGVLPLILGALLCGTVAPAPGALISHLGTDQVVQVICVTWSDHAGTRLASCNDWATLLNNEIDNFYDQATHGQTTFVFQAPAGAPNNGWLALGYPTADYDFQKVGQDAVSLADPYVDFSNVNRVAVITNNPNFGGQGGFGWDWAVDEGVEHTRIEDGVSVGKRYMSMSIVNEWQTAWGTLPFDAAAAVVGHELGHHLDLKTHYGSVGWFPGGPRDAITPWDIMGLSPHRNHFLGWAKLERQWTPGIGVQTVGPPTAADIVQDIALSPSETAGGVDLIRIPITAGPLFTGYTVETRRQINGDENLPEAGVLLAFVDENPGTVRKAIVLDDAGSPGDLYQAALEVGDSYADTARNLTVTYLSQNGNDANVRVEYRLPPALPPNPLITPWGAPPWETVDIWVDSEQNGWDVYRYTDGSGNPVGNGDDAWVDHVNRIYFRIGNGGTGAAGNVRVRVYANEPPGMGDRGADWKYLGTAVFPNIAAGDTEVGYVNWVPEVGQHTCIKVEIIATDEEITATDNVAQENVTAFDTTSGSAYRPRCRRFIVNNPFADRETRVLMQVRDIPPRWAVQVEPDDFVLPPAASDEVCMSVFPPAQDEEYAPGYIGRPKLQAMVPYANTFIPIGGIDVWAHLSTRSQLTCDSNGSNLLQDGPAADGPEAGLAPSAPTLDPGRPIAGAGALEQWFLDASLVGPLPEPVAVGLADVILAEGRLQPGFSGATIAVDFRSGATRETRLVQTDAQGRWSAQFDPATGGLWEVKAHFAGDLSRAAASSNRCRYQVERREPTTPACDCTPGATRLAHLLAILAALFAFWLFYTAYRERGRLCERALIAALILLALGLIGLLSCWAVHAGIARLLLLLAAAVFLWWLMLCRRREGLA